MTTRRAVLSLGLLIGMRVAPVAAHKKHRGPRRCPRFKPDGVCAAGEVFSVKWDRCLPRTGIVDGVTYFCKGHKHPWFVVADDGTLHCCRRECTPTIVTIESGLGLCHNWKPKLCIVEEGEQG